MKTLILAITLALAFSSCAILKQSPETSGFDWDLIGEILNEAIDSDQMTREEQIDLLKRARGATDNPRIIARIDREIERLERKADPKPPEDPRDPEDPPADIPPGTVWIHRNVSSWDITTTLDARVEGGAIHLRYDKTNAWPVLDMRAQDGGPLVGNVWAFVQHNGVWHAVAWDWMRQGQQSKGKSLLRGAGGHMPAPLQNYVPRSGETLGLMVSSGGRSAEAKTRERSQVVFIVWP